MHYTQNPLDLYTNFLALLSAHRNCRLINLSQGGAKICRLEAYASRLAASANGKAHGQRFIQCDKIGCFDLVRPAGIG